MTPTAEGSSVAIGKGRTCRVERRAPRAARKHLESAGSSLARRVLKVVVTERVRQPPQPPTLRPREGSMPPLAPSRGFFCPSRPLREVTPVEGTKADRPRPRDRPMEHFSPATCPRVPRCKPTRIVSPIEIATGPRSPRSGGSPNPRRSVSVSGSFDNTPGSPRCTSCRTPHPCPASYPPCSRSAGSGTRPNPHIVDAAVPW
jgi:hypothetical protein